MAIQDITKPMALDETLQATNQALGGVAKDTSLQATNTALGLLGKDSSLQAIVTALATIGLNTVGNLAQLTTEQKTSLVAAINELMAGKIPNSAIGVANGVAELDANGLVPSSQIPDAVDEIIEGYLYNGTFYEDSAHTKPITGKTGKIYVDLSTEKTYRWGGSAYVEISASLALGETSSTAYRGDRGKTAYDHSQDASRVTSAIVEGLYKVGATAQGHISSLSAVQKSDITSLGIPGQDTTYNDATQSVHGLMSANDKTKLDGISTGANKVEASDTNGNIKIDDTETQVYDDSDIQAKISTALTPISGNPISISGLKSTQLAVDPIITFEPIQAGSGTPSPENIRPISGYDKIEVLSCGVNIWDEQWEVGYYDPSTGLPVAGNANLRSKNSNPILAVGNKTYYWYCPRGARIFFYDVNDNYIENMSSGVGYITFTTPANTVYMRFHVAGEYGTTYQNNISMNYPSTDTSYHAYHKTTDLSESIGQTVYGATWYPRTGKLLSNMILTNLKGKTAVAYGDDGIYISNVLNRSASAVQGICSHALAKNASTWQSGDMLLGSSNATIYWKGILSILGKTLSEFNTWLASNDVWVCYDAGSDTEIQLTPHEISLLEQYAYVSTNGTTIALDYHQGEMASLGDVEELYKTVERDIVRSQHVYSTTEQVIGTWIDGKPLYQKTVICTATQQLNNSSWTQIQWNNEPNNIYQLIDAELNAIDGVPNTVGNIRFLYDNNHICGASNVTSGNVIYSGQIVTFRYTKTTD